MDFQKMIYENVKTKQFISQITYPTLGNLKKQQQIKFYKKLLSELISLRVTKNLKMFYFTCPTVWVLKKYTTGGYL